MLWALERRDFEALVSGSVPLLRALNRALADHVGAMMRQLEDLAAGAESGPAGLRFGPYRVTAQIGAGGMAAVYSAVHEDTEAAVAVKVLPAAWGDAPELRGRLAREADALHAAIA